MKNKIDYEVFEKLPKMVTLSQINGPFHMNVLQEGIEKHKERLRIKEENIRLQKEAKRMYGTKTTNVSQKEPSNRDRTQ